jgi:hypothetical protein
MDLQNLDNYPVYILNVVPELSEESNPQMSQQINSDEPLAYNFYLPNVEDHTTMVNREIILPVDSRKNKSKPVRQSPYGKIVHNIAGNHKQNTE